MLVGAAIVPAAPLLVAGVSAALPDGVAEVRAAVRGAVSALAAADPQVAILVAAGDPPGVYAPREATLRGFGRPDIAAPLIPAGDGLVDPLPEGLAVLALLLELPVPVLPVAVDPGNEAPTLAALGRELAEDPRRAVLLAAGDGSAGLGERSPRWRIEGAAAWDAALAAAVAAHDAAALAVLGPHEARRVWALGWAPIVVATAAARRWRVCSYSAPRGVGYLVATGEAAGG